MYKLPEIQHYIYDPKFFSEKFINIAIGLQSEIIQKLKIDHNNIKETKPPKINHLLSQTFQKKTNTSFEVHQQKRDTVIHSRQMNSNINEATDTDFIFKLLFHHTHCEHSFTD